MTEKDKIFCEPFPCKDYMYKLWQQWGEEEKQCIFIMLNPARTHDLEGNRTVKNCKAIAKNENCGSMVLLDLFPYVAGSWSVLMEKRKQGKDIKNNEVHEKYIEQVLKRPNILIVIAWDENRSGEADDIKCFNDQIEHMEGMIKKHALNAEIRQLEKRNGKEGTMIHPWRLTISENARYSEKAKPYRLESYKYKYQ